MFGSCESWRRRRAPPSELQVPFFMESTTHSCFSFVYFSDGFNAWWLILNHLIAFQLYFFQRKRKSTQSADSAQ